MAAELLRAAAVLLRERAEAATTGPWERAADSDTAAGRHYRDNTIGNWDGRPFVEAGQVTCDMGDGDQAAADARYVALMHPPVALALADLLWIGANDAETYVTQEAAAEVYQLELVVARAVLREVE